MTGTLSSPRANHSISSRIPPFLAGRSPQPASTTRGSRSSTVSSESGFFSRTDGGASSGATISARRRMSRVVSGCGEGYQSSGAFMPPRMTYIRTLLSIHIRPASDETGAELTSPLRRGMMYVENSFGLLSARPNLIHGARSRTV
jgi:hypothetical protein